jgi:hypothetical protein
LNARREWVKWASTPGENGLKGSELEERMGLMGLNTRREWVKGI